jgi:hypothetical protein
MTQLDDDTTRELDALSMIEAFAAGDQEAAFWTVARYQRQHDKLALAVAGVASLMISGPRAAADELANFRAYLLRQGD